MAEDHDDLDDADDEVDLDSRFDAVNDQYGKFERIKKVDRLHPSRRLCGILKLASLFKKPEDFDFSAEHDIVHFADADDLKPLTDKDVLYLTRCGFHYDSECDGLAMFC